MKIMLMSFGSRGDIPPFIGLALALQQRGHEVKLAAPLDFESLALSHNIFFAAIPLSIKEILEQDSAKQFLNQGIKPWALYRLMQAAIPEMQRVLYETMQIVVELVKDADLLISHGLLLPFAYTIHQLVKVPVILGIAAPVVNTTAFPAPMFSPLPFAQNVYNPLTYHLMLRLLFSFMISPMNRYRQENGLEKEEMANIIRYYHEQFPIMMHYSRYLLENPPDWSENVHVTGVWTLPSAEDWRPPANLMKFLEEGDAPVYIGFGSMPVPNSAKFLKNLGAALHETKLRGLVQAGWAGLAHEDEHLMTIGDAPHDWLFPRMAAIIHHGGSGTTHSAVSAGKPSLIVPFSADQPFWGQRLAQLGVAVPPIALKKLNRKRLANLLVQLTQDEAMRERAEALGTLVREENGLGKACELIERMGVNQG